MMNASTKLVEDALKAHFQTDDVGYHEGMFAIKDHGLLTLKQARKLTGVTAPQQAPQMVMAPWGDYATIAQINRIKR